MNYKKYLERRVARLERRLLCESKQVGTLYHTCSLSDYLKYIMPNDTLQASGLYANAINGENNWVSFTRNQNYIFNKHNTNILVRLVVDGDKLSERYKVTPINSIAALANSYNNEYGVDVNNLDDDELLELGLLDEDDIESGVNYKDVPELRESEEAVKGPIKNISKYIKEIQIDITRIDARSLSLLNANSDKLQPFVYTSFIPNDDKDKELFIYLNSKLGKTAPFTELLNLLNKFMQDSSNSNSNQTDKFIELCKANKWKVKPTREGAVCFAPATKLGYYSTDSIAILYNISSDTIEIMGSQRHLNLSHMRPSSFVDHMTELALSY